VNEVSEAEFLSQVGDQGYREVARLAEWLLTTEMDANLDVELSCRYAPSIITKGEAEIFGLSDPRFAIRLYLENGEGTSLVNLRRIERMREANPRWGRRMRWLKCYSQDPVKALPTPKDRPRELLERASRIGDCLLQPPKRITTGREKWVVLQADLGREYGETSEEGGFRGTPYLRHIPLAGGGLCAQAVCFMATSLLHQYATGVHGLLEVTALAQRDAMKQAEADGYSVYEMQISGLNYGGLTNYFRSVGLRAIKQVPKTMGYAEPTADWTNRQDAFTAAARAYVRSGMPVVLTVDVGRLAAPVDPITQMNCGLVKPVERPIYAQNGWEHEGFAELERGTFQQRRDHAVLLVGCKETAGSEAFLINDPASLPFLQATTGQLSEAGYYASRWSKRRNRRIDNFEELRSLHCMPVTPGAVKLPLLWWLPESQVDEEDAPRAAVEHWQDGLFGIIPVLFSGAIQIGRSRIPFIPAHQRYRNFRLVQLGDLVRHCAELLQGQEHLPDIASLREQLMERFDWTQSHWAWVQFVKDPLSIWIYDAEMELPHAQLERTVDSGRGFLRVGVWKEGDTWREVVVPRVRRPEEPRSDEEVEFRKQRPSGPPLPLSVSSASAAHGVREYLETLGQEANRMELYAFMRPDIDALSESPWQHPAISWMAQNTHPRKVRDIAQQLLAWADEAGVSLQDISTYLPELAGLHEGDGKMAVDALVFLAALNDALRAEGASGGTGENRTITIVAGNRIQGIWPARLAREDAGMVYMANVVSRATLGETLLKRLREVSRQMDAASPVRFALELEPGELHLLNDWDAMAWFALELETESWKKDLGDRLGFSLNIPRWAFLAGIRPSQLDGDRGVAALIRKRILHAHVSDIGKGQFGGLAPGLMHKAEDYEPWLDLLHELANESRVRGMEFSRVLSLVMEGCKDETSVIDALKRLRSWEEAREREVR